MSDLARLMGRPTPPSDTVYLLFNSQFIVEIDDFEKGKALVEKLGESSFDDLDELGDRSFDVWPKKSLEEFEKWIMEETDHIIEHDPSYWDNR